jgi:hypothetical protein
VKLSLRDLVLPKKKQCEEMELYKSVQVSPLSVSSTLVAECESAGDAKACVDSPAAGSERGQWSEGEKEKERSNDQDIGHGTDNDGVEDVECSTIVDSSTLILSSSPNPSI